MSAAIATAAAPVRCWESELVEHVAVFAAQNGLSDLEALCDSALAGDLDERIVLEKIGEDPALEDWCARDQRYRTRAIGGAS